MRKRSRWGLRIQDTGFGSCDWKCVEKYPTGAERHRCKVCAAEFVGMMYGGIYSFVFLDHGEKNTHAPDPKPMDDWVSGLDLSGL